jgi:hypothetical protein
MNHELHIAGEISAYEHQLEVINTLKLKIKEGTNELKASYKAVIDSKSIFQEIKKQNIEEIRQYKFAIASECKEIKTQADAITSAFSKDRISSLKEFADVCERISKLENDGFFKTFSFKA